MSDIHPATPMGSPPQQAAMTPGQAAEVSPGRAACEAFWDAAGEARADIAWQWAGNQMTRKAWDAAAQAAVTAGTGRILAEAARYKAERDEAHAQLAREDGDFEARLAVLDSVIAERDALQALIDAGQPTLARQVLAITAERDALAGENHALRAANDDWRELAAEILDELDQWELLVEDDRRAEWRKRAGLEPS